MTDEDKPFRMRCRECGHEDTFATSAEASKALSDHRCGRKAKREES